MKNRIDKREIFSIPNLMGYFRILLIPLFSWMYCTADSTGDYYAAAVVVGVSGLTDMFDGKIARRFHMITELGKFIDPLADKLTQAALLICLAIRYPLMRAVLVLFVLFYHKLFAITFDENFSRATGLRVEWYNTLLAVLTALTIVLGMRMMGAMLISSLVIFPALTAMRLFKSFRGVVICAGVTSVCCFCVGLMASWTLSTPVGASVVMADLLLFLLSCGASWLRRR